MRDRSRTARRSAALVIGFALTLALAGCSGGQRQTAAATATLIPVPTSPPTQTPAPNPWKSFTTLTTVASFAPAQWRTKFEASTGALAKGAAPALWVRRSDDFGVTYHNVSLPTIPGGTNPTNVQYISGEQSPLDPRVYFLTVQTQGSCADSEPCQYQYVTMDGGVSWRPLSLPVYGVLGVMNDANKGEIAQGQRLYGVVTDLMLAASGAVPPGRLVTSVDGGLTWSVADAAVFAAGGWIYNVAVTPTGSTVFALAGKNYGTGENQPNPVLTLWRSEDAGATWTHEGAPPAQETLDIRAAVIASTGKTALYALGGDAQSSVRVYASVDGGATWPDSYTFPISTDASGPGVTLIGSFADGAVAIASFDNSTLAWAPGDPTPTTIFPAPPGVTFIQSEVLTPPDSHGMYTLWIVSSDSNNKPIYDYASAQ